MVSYYVFDQGDRTTGLVRLTQSNDGTITRSIETVRDGQWIDNPGAIKYFWCYGGIQTDVIELSVEQAQARAAELGVAI